jgi:hypothetical protein
MKNKVQESVEYPDVINLLDKLDVGVPVNINFIRGEKPIVLQGACPTKAKEFLHEWISPFGKCTYCEGDHVIEKDGGVERHMINLEYGLCNYTWIHICNKEKPYEWATITYTLAD